MQSKLTLSLESSLIERAKKQAKKQGKSLSQMVADYFLLFDQPSQAIKLAPVTQSLKGIIKDKTIDEGDYKKYLEKKYL